MKVPGQPSREQIQQNQELITQALNAARAALDQAETAIAKLRGDIDSSKRQQDSLRDKLDEDQAAVAEARKELARIEDEILDSQGADSALGQKIAELDQARAALQTEIRRVLANPAVEPELAKLSADQRKTLNRDAAYAAAYDRMSALSKEAEAIRRDLFQKSPEWSAAKAKLQQAIERERSDSDEAAQLGRTMNEARKALNAQEQTAASARAVVTTGEAQLREMGVRPTPEKGNTPREPMQPNRDSKKD